MASYTAQVILSDPNYDSDTPQYAKGDIVSVYPLITEKPSTNGKLAFIHVHNVPDNINLENLCNELSRPEISNATVDVEVSKTRAWMINLNALDDYDLLVSDREVSIEWAVAVSAFIRKFDGMTGGEYYAGLIL